MICEFFQAVFLIEIFDLPDKDLKYAKELFLNPYRNSMTLQDIWVDVKLVTNHLRKVFRSRIHKAAERNTPARINSDKLTDTNSKGFHKPLATGTVNNLLTVI